MNQPKNEFNVQSDAFIVTHTRTHARTLYTTQHGKHTNTQHYYWFIYKMRWKGTLTKAQNCDAVQGIYSNCLTEWKTLSDLLFVLLYFYKRFVFFSLLISLHLFLSSSHSLCLPLFLSLRHCCFLLASKK